MFVVQTRSSTWRALLSCEPALLELVPPTFHPRPPSLAVVRIDSHLGMSTLTLVMASGSLPLLSPVAASAGSLLVTATYVGSLYLAKSARIPHAASSNSSSEAASSAEEERLRLGRDHPDVIRARLKAVGGATVACCVGVWAVVQLGLGEPTSWLKGVSPHHKLLTCRRPG